MGKHDWAFKRSYLRYVCKKCGKEADIRALSRRRPGGSIGLKRGGCRE